MFVICLVLLRAVLYYSHKISVCISFSPTHATCLVPLIFLDISHDNICWEVKQYLPVLKRPLTIFNVFAVVLSISHSYGMWRCVGEWVVAEVSKDSMPSSLVSRNPRRMLLDPKKKSVLWNVENFSPSDRKWHPSITEYSRHDKVAAKNGRRYQNSLHNGHLFVILMSHIRNWGLMFSRAPPDIAAK